MNPSSVGLAHFWQQGDLVTHAVAMLLLGLSLVSWYLIISRLIAQVRLHRAVEQAPALFWQAGSLPEALAAMARVDRAAIFTEAARAGAIAAHRVQCPTGQLSPSAESCQTCGQRQAGCQAARSLGAGVSVSENVTRALRNHLFRVQASLESGLTVLASVGSTAPFIGLFGTVWGIYHALTALSGATQVVLDKVAGPVGEALIMTAAGLFVAIPAVLAYNALVRGNRLVMARLDAFAHDLHGYFTTGAHQGEGSGSALAGIPAGPVKLAVVAGAV